MLWFIPVGNNIPKDFTLRKLGERMQNDILDAMTACNLALQTRDLHQRMELISLVKLHITSVQNISRVLVEFSSREGNVKRVISLRQRDALLRMMASIGSQLSRWANATISSIKALD